MQRPAKILEQSWFSFKIHFGTCSVGEWGCVWKTRRRLSLIPTHSITFCKLWFGKIKCVYSTKRTFKILQIKQKKREKKKIAFYRMQRIESHKWFCRTALAWTLAWTVNKYVSIVFPFPYFNWLLFLDTLWNPSEDLSIGKFSLAGSFVQICLLKGSARSKVLLTPPSF